MKKYKYHYTYLIENLKPTDARQYYIGVKSCDILPAENIDYMGSSSYLTEAIRYEGIDNFQKTIIKEFITRDKAEAYEKSLQLAYNVAANPQFYNRRNGVIGWHTTKESIAKAQQTKSKKEWQDTVGKAGAKKCSATKLDPNWKETTGRLALLSIPN